jgi:DNA replication protein DnaT
MKWIKVECALFEKIEVQMIAKTLKVDRDKAAALCIRVWRWADDQTEDGFVRWLAYADVDDVIGYKGIGKAMHDAGWLEEDRSGLMIPNFIRHNGQSAKRRALDAERKSRSRDRK